jgi:uncharacterized MAPEG superfamily protein
MSALLIVLLITVLLPYLVRIPVAKAMHNIGGYDNHLPRVQQAKLEGLGARANAAHYNSFEALQVYLAAFAASIAANLVDPTQQTLAWVFVAARVLFIVFYLMDKALLRSIVWTVAIGAAIAMIVRSMLVLA